MTKLTDMEREQIIKDILGYTSDEIQQVYRECDESECSWCRWKHCCLFDDHYLANVLEDLNR